jgi:hypothetical protein
LQRARSLAVAGQCDEAIPEYSRALQLMPGHPELLRERGECLGRMGRKDDALRDLNAYLVAFPSAPDAAAVRERMAQIQAGVTAPPPPPQQVAQPQQPPQVQQQQGGVVLVAPPASPNNDMVVVTPPPPEGRRRNPGLDGGRFRGGIEMDGGLFKPPVGALGAIGPSGQIGYQINNEVGIYGTPGFTILFGDAGGVDFNVGLVVDYTFFDDQFTIGAGPEAGAFLFVGSTAAGGGAGYGGRLHFAWNAIVSRGDDGIRRKALVIGLDARFIIGPEATATASNNFLTGATSGSVSNTGFTFAPLLSIGYVAF